MSAATAVPTACTVERETVGGRSAFYQRVRAMWCAPLQRECVVGQPPRLWRKQSPGVPRGHHRGPANGCLPHQSFGTIALSGPCAVPSPDGPLGPGPK